MSRVPLEGVILVGFLPIFATINLMSILRTFATGLVIVTCAFLCSHSTSSPWSAVFVATLVDTLPLQFRPDR